MFKFLFAIFLISCVSNQNSKITPEPQNLTKNNIPEKQYTPTTNKTDSNSQPTILIPTDTSKTKSNSITSIIVEETATATPQKKTEKAVVKKKVNKPEPQVQQATKKVTTPTGYSVQVAAFKEIGLAEQKKFTIDQTLKKSGIIADSYIITKDSYYKILIGNYSDKKTAEVLKASLNSVNINGFIVK